MGPCHTRRGREQGYRVHAPSTPLCLWVERGRGGCFHDRKYGGVMKRSSASTGDLASRWSCVAYMQMIKVVLFGRVARNVWVHG